MVKVEKHEAEVRVIREAGVTVEMDIETASMVVSLLGRTTGHEGGELYTNLKRVLGADYHRYTVSDRHGESIGSLRLRKDI